MLAKVTAALVAYGPWGILLLAFIDSAGIPVATGMDALVVLVAIKSPERAWLAASLGVLGSLAGNLALFLGARKGLSRFIAHPPPEEERLFRRWFRRYGLLTCFIPALMPIPLPLKVSVVSAAMLRTPMSAFVAVILLARAIRYFGEAYLGVKLGEGSGAFLRAHRWALIGGAAAFCAVLYALLAWKERTVKR
jgi:membrane protein YqaA with SNARE-associated domain